MAATQKPALQRVTPSSKWALRWGEGLWQPLQACYFCPTSQLVAGGWVWGDTSWGPSVPGLSRLGQSSRLEGQLGSRGRPRELGKPTQPGENKPGGHPPGRGPAAAWAPRETEPPAAWLHWLGEEASCTGSWGHAWLKFHRSNLFLPRKISGKY